MSRVSSVTPCHDCGALVGPMLDSLAAQAASDGEPAVVDDRSTDDSAEPPPR